MLFHLQPRLLVTLLIPAALIAFGTAGYVAIERWSVFDSLYMTVITLTTVGFMEVHPLSTAGRAFTMALTTGGVFTMFYAAAEVLRAVVGGEIAAALGRRRMERNLERIDDHVIVCGLGRMGRRVAQELAANGIAYVAIERDPAPAGGPEPPGGLVVIGDATHEETLVHAGIARARAVITVLASDADNLLVTMTARLLSEKLLIVARAEDDRTNAKLERAGANRVVSPYVLGGHRVAQAVIRPAVLDFVDLAMKSGHIELQLEETRISAASRLHGATPRDVKMHDELGILLVGVVTGDRVVYAPKNDTVLSVGDTLIAMGSRANLDRLRQLASGN